MSISNAPATGLVGRGPELAALQADLARTAGGSPGAVLLVGAPGVGKTSLAAAALSRAGELGFSTFAGRARPLGRDVGYAPLVEAFGAFLRGLDESERDRLLDGIGQLALLFTGIGLTPPVPLGDPDLERSRLFDGFVRLIERLAHDQPLALMLDDLHAADTATFSFVAHVASGLTEHPVLFLLTARPDDPERQRAAQLTAAMSGSSWWLATHEIEPLRAQDAAELAGATLAGLAPGRVDPAVVERIVERCAGRPLFLDALARTVAESGLLVEHGGALTLGEHDLPLPEGVRAQLQTRIAGTSADERAVLDLLATAGRGLPFETLRRASGLDAGRATTALDGLHHRRLLRDESDDGVAYDLVHGLLRDTLLAELSPIAERTLHARLVTTLRESAADDPRLAEHALGAGEMLDQELALEILVQGGTHALALGMVDAAARYLDAAVHTATACNRTDLLADLHGQHAYALRRAGRPAQARAAWEAALAASVRSGSPGQVARVEEELGLLDWGVGELDTAREHFARAAAALEGLAPSADHAALLYTQTITASRIGDAETVVRTAAGLRELAEQLHSPGLVAQAYLAEAVLDYTATDYVRMTDRNLAALEAAERSGEPLLVIRAHDQLSVAAASQLDLAGLRRHSEQSLRIARELGGLILEPWPRARLAMADLLAGKWDSVLAVTSDITVQAIRYDEQRGAVSSSAGHALVLVHLGRLADARRYLEQARSAAQPMLEADHNVFSIVAIADATLALVEGEPERAVTWAAQLGTTTGGWMPLLGLAVLGEAQTAAGRTDEALVTAERLRAVRSASTCAPATLSDWVAGLTRLGAGEHEAAAPLLDSATAGFRTLGLPFYTARGQLAHARAVQPSSPGDAVELARAALDTFDRLGAPIWARQARERLRELGVVPSRGRRRTGAEGPLSERELQVGRLVASGNSNAEVAAELFISPRTVTTHLERIYGKLGLSSRVALTRYLADSGLLAESAP